ncbi:GcrA family cell cycle regulator [Thalassospira sp.]|uniref:GcrA family cell cycle regulator n=1 Tax=Thalassospira sp. TaxID=1912094 RepID=UPI0032EAB01C
MSWTPEKIELLTSLWNQGWTTARIGEELGVGKNAVVGKAHRLGLPKRPSPIQRRAEEAEQKKAPAPKQPAKGITIYDLGVGMCRWPFGDPDHDDFHFCGKKIVPSKPYCLEHCTQAYLNGKSPREDNPPGQQGGPGHKGPQAPTKK